MPLKSNLFAGNSKLEACLVDHAAHVTKGASGDHVGRIQVALVDLDEAPIAEAEMERKFYGSTTAAAVLAYKRRRAIINRSYQSTPDDIVGKMTIESLDSELFQKQEIPIPHPKMMCSRPLSPALPARNGNAARASLLASLSPEQLEKLG